MRRGGVGALALVTAVIAIAPAAGAEELPPGFWGVDTVDPPTVGEAQLMRQTGIEVTRATFHWRAIEAQPPGLLGELLGTRSYNWRRTDAWVGNAARAGVRVNALLFGSPDWMSPIDNYAPTETAEQRAAWRQFVRAVVSRYGRGGSFWAQNPDLSPRPIEVFHIWNEQNSGAAYRPQPSVRGYAGLLRIAAEEIRAADPRARVVLGGMFATPTLGASIRAWRFLRELYEIPGIRQHFDAVGLHPYAPDMRGIRWQVRRFLRVMQRAGDRRTPIEITEIGWSSDRRDTHFFYVGPRMQAQLLSRSFRLLLRNRESWRIERIIWHTWRDLRPDHSGCNWCHRFGLVHPDLTPKPAHRAYRRIANGGSAG